MYLLWVIWERAVHIGSAQVIMLLQLQKALLIAKFRKQPLGSVIGGAFLGTSHGLPTPTATKVILIILI